MKRGFEGEWRYWLGTREGRVILGILGVASLFVIAALLVLIDRAVF